MGQVVTQSGATARSWPARLAVTSTAAGQGALAAPGVQDPGRLPRQGAGQPGGIVAPVLFVPSGDRAGNNGGPEVAYTRRGIG